MRLPAVHPFLLSLLKTGADSTAPARPSPESHDEWTTIVGDAVRHGLAAILYRRLNESGWIPKLPPAPMDELKAHVFKQAARNMSLAREAAAILRAFASRQVLCAPVRGLALAELLYGEITTRPMGDLDLLVRKEDLHAVAETLLELGFQAIDRRPGFARAYSNAMEFVKHSHGWVIVEPHWSIAYPPFADRVDMDAVWIRSTRGQVVGTDTWLLSPEDYLLHLCLHLIHRRDDAPLLWFYELDRFIRLTDVALDWSQVAQTARETGQTLLIAEVLERTRSLFETPIPQQVCSQVGWSAGDGVAHLLAGNSRADGRESLALFFAIKGLRAKMRYALALLFPSSEFMRVNYRLSSRSRIGFCYLRRIASLACKALKGILGLLAVRQGTLNR